MLRYINLVIILTAFLTITNAQQPEYIKGKLIIKYNTKTHKSNFTEKIRIEDIQNNTGILIKEMKPMFPWQMNIKAENSNQLENIYTITFDEKINPIELASQLNCLSDVVYAQPYWIPEKLFIPNDPLQGSQYYLSLIKAYDAFGISQGDSNIVIGIVDTGIDQYHDDLAANIKINYSDPINGIDDDMDGFVDNYRGWDISDGDNNPQSATNHHGTYVAGMASAVTNNGIGITGIGYHTKILPIKVESRLGIFDAAWEGLVYAADHNCKIINCSWGSTVPGPLIDDIIAYAVEYRRCLVVAACGNERTDKKYYPAACKGVLSVAATNWQDFKWSNSTYGITVDICAPGEAVYTTTYGNTYNSGWGTSFASPLVAGAAALVWAKFPDWQPEQVAEQLRITGDIIDTLPDNLFYRRQMGYGRLNVYKALTDTNLPSVRITEYEISSSGQGLYAGETLKTGITLKNYLSQVSASTIRLSSESEYVTMIKSTWSTGEINTLETKSNSGSLFEFVLAENTPEDNQLRLWFDIRAEGYEDYQAIDIIVNPSYVNVETSKIKTTLSGYGKVGYTNIAKKIGIGLIYNDSYNILSDAGIILSSGSTVSASSWQDERQFTILERIDTSSILNKYLSAKSVLKPASFAGIDVQIHQEFRIFPNEPSVIYCIYTIRNMASDPTGELRFGFYNDWDLINIKSNIGDFDSDNQLLYVKNISATTLYSGICLLNDDQSIPYVFDIITGGNGGIDITDGFSKEEKWFAMNNPRTHGGNNGDSLNIAQMLTYKIENINANDTSTVAFAMLVADNLYQLTEMARQVRLEYQKSDILIPEIRNEGFYLYPNPLQASVLHINLPANSIQLSIFNQQGSLVYTDKNVLDFNQDIDISKWGPGVYFVSIQTLKNKLTRKLIITR
jgi:serine protease